MVVALGRGIHKVVGSTIEAARMKLACRVPVRLRSGQCGRLWRLPLAAGHKGAF
jgi:hypothetical protein